MRASYGALDRLLHRLAFRTGIAQETLCDMENLLFGSKLRGVRIDRPVFVSGLPRAGTTILLNLLTATGRFASHTYRDMPFVLSPLLWERFSRRFGAELPARERAHGDGLEISGDSPEAFEEVLWKRFWPDHYRPDRIRPWAPDERDAEFDELLERHMRKVVLVRGGSAEGELRYLSKNNVNIARLAAAPRPLRDGILLIPFREPVQHAASMLAQHLRFTALQEEDPFVLEYMNGIGHHDFGRGLRPIDFPGDFPGDFAGDFSGSVSGDSSREFTRGFTRDSYGWLPNEPDPTSLEFWVRYWIAAYGFVAEHVAPGTRSVPRAHLVSFTELTANPEASLLRIARLTELPGGTLSPLASEVRAPGRHDVPEAAVPADVLHEAERLHARLEDLAGE